VLVYQPDEFSLLLAMTGKDLMFPKSPMWRKVGEAVDYSV